MGHLSKYKIMRYQIIIANETLKALQKLGVLVFYRTVIEVSVLVVCGARLLDDLCQTF